MSACIADRFATVSSKLSPLAVLERAMSRLMTSADRRVAAISNVVRVRVEFSKNRLKTLLPRSSGTFLTSRLLTLTKLAAVSRICVSVALGRPSMDSRWISSPFLLSCGFRRYSTLCSFGSELFLLWVLLRPSACRPKLIVHVHVHVRLHGSCL